MDKLAKPLALLALLLTIGPPAWMLVEGVAADRASSQDSDDPAPAEPAASAPADDGGIMTENRMKQLMAFGAVLWFATAPFWLKEDKPAEQIIEDQGLQTVP
jgi:hypothetical protein